MRTGTAVHCANKPKYFQQLSNQGDLYKYDIFSIENILYIRYFVLNVCERTVTTVLMPILNNTFTPERIEV